MTVKAAAEKNAKKLSGSDEPAVPVAFKHIPLWFREVLIFTFTCLFFAYWALIGIDPHHDGVMLIPAIRVSQGAAVFRDVFCQYGLLVPLLQGGAVAVFGAELLVIRLLTVLFYAGSAVLLDLLWRRFLPSGISYLVPVLFSLLAPCTMATFHSWNSVYALFFMLGYAYCIVAYLEKTPGNKWFLFLAGISAALTWACRMPCGVVTVLAALMVLTGGNFFAGKQWREIFPENLLFFAGALLIALMAGIYIYVTGGVDDFIRQNFNYVTDFVHNRGGKGSWQFFCDSIFPFYQDGLWLFNSLFALMPVTALILLYFSCRKGLLGGAEAMRGQLPFIALLILGLGSWHQYYPVACIRHLFWGGMPMIGAYILVMNKLFAGKKILNKAVLGILVLVLVSGVFVRFTGMAIRGNIFRRSAGIVAGVRGIMVHNSEKRLTEIAVLGGNVPEAIKERGFMVLGEDSLFLAMVKECSFKDLCFYSVKSRQYPDYEKRQLHYIAENKPMIICDREIFLPGYIIYRKSRFMGKEYIVLLPLN